MKSGQKVSKHKIRSIRSRVIENIKKADLSKSGIYAIINLKNDHVYVGQSKCISDRWKSHRGDLNAGRHGNPYLQNAWRLHGKEVFHFGVLEFCEISSLNDREQYWIERLEPVYNIAKNVFKNVYDEPLAGSYRNKGENFFRPEWHLWVYGGKKHSQITRK